MTYTARILLVVFLTIGVSQAIAQTEDCEVTINRALDEFNAGHFYIIPNVLSPCLNNFTTDQKQRAYLLLTQTYLLLEDPIGSKESFLSLLKANPEFVTDTAVHSIDVIYLSKRFTATSIFSWFAKAGTNTSFADVIYDQKTFGETTAVEDYQNRFGYQASVGGDVTVMGRISARAELGYSMMTYKHTSKNYFQFDSKEFIDRQSWMSLPVSVVYSDHIGKYRPYGYIGYSFQYLLADKGQITITNNKPISTSSDEVLPGEVDRENASEESPPLNLLYKRNRLNQSVFVGGGLKVKVGLDFIFVDVRYSMGLKNVVSEKNRYGDFSGDGIENYYSGEHIQSLDPSFRYLHVDDYFRLNNLSISVGFLRPLYKPRELKHVRTKSVMKLMKNR
jgi:hypothetical protein